jgi:hypothetical protein
LEPVVRQETGEICHVAFVVRAKHLRGGFFLGMQAAFVALAQDQTLKGETYRVLLYLFGVLDFENETGIAHADIAENLQMRTQHVTRAMKTLMERGYIHRTGKVGKFWKYRIDPDVVFKGRAKNIETVKKEIQRAKLTVLDGGGKESSAPTEASVEAMLRLASEPTTFDKTEQ